MYEIGFSSPSGCLCRSTAPSPYEDASADTTVQIIPGPNELRLHINSFLEPLVEDLQQLWKGVEMTTPEGVKTVHAALLCTSSDIPVGQSEKNVSIFKVNLALILYCKIPFKTVYRPKTHICVIYNVRAGHQRRIYAYSTLTSALQEIGLPQAIRNNCSVSSGIVLAVSVVISSDVTKVGV